MCAVGSGDFGCADGLDQFLADYRVALECVLRDLKEDSAARQATASPGESAISTDPNFAATPSVPTVPPADGSQRTSAEVATELLKDAAQFEEAGQTLRDLLAGLPKKTEPTDGGKPSDEPAPK